MCSWSLLEPTISASLLTWEAHGRIAGVPSGISCAIAVKPVLVTAYSEIRIGGDTSLGMVPSAKLGWTDDIGDSQRQESP